jgi:hypothetical protein
MSGTTTFSILAVSLNECPFREQVSECHLYTFLKCPRPIIRYPFSNS